MITFIHDLKYQIDYSKENVDCHMISNINEGGLTGDGSGYGETYISYNGNGDARPGARRNGNGAGSAGTDSDGDGVGHCDPWDYEFLITI